MPGRPPMGQEWTQARLKAALWRFAQERGRWPTLDDLAPVVRPTYLPHHATIWRAFGGLDVAIHATELEYHLCPQEEPA